MVGGSKRLQLDNLEPIIYLTVMCCILQTSGNYVSSKKLGVYMTDTASDYVFRKLWLLANAKMLFLLPKLNNLSASGDGCCSEDEGKRFKEEHMKRIL